MILPQEKNYPTPEPGHNSNALAMDYDPIPADDALERLTKLNIYMYGHGAPGVEQAESILRNGLNLKLAKLSSTTRMLSTEADDNNAYLRSRSLLDNWPHNAAEPLLY